MRWPFTGREAELELIAAELERGSTNGVVIAGPAGVGKTRLTAKTAELAGAQGCAVEWARASRSARTIPLGAFAALLPAAGAGSGLELLAGARQALAERAAGRRLVLCVDDGQLLDEGGRARASARRRPRGLRGRQHAPRRAGPRRVAGALEGRTLHARRAGRAVAQRG